jgi:hypothetical protein
MAGSDSGWRTTGGCCSAPTTASTLFYCEPGIDGAHEKGGVEGDVGRFRRTWLSPIPEVDSLAELNARMRDWDQRDEARHIGMRMTTVAEDFAAEHGRLNPLPRDRFDPGWSYIPGWIAPG